MGTKLESYIKEIKNFLAENYICYEYKLHTLIVMSN